MRGGHPTERFRIPGRSVVLRWGTGSTKPTGHQTPRNHPTYSQQPLNSRQLMLIGIFWNDLSRGLGSGAAARGDAGDAEENKETSRNPAQPGGCCSALQHGVRQHPPLVATVVPHVPIGSVERLRRVFDPRHIAVESADASEVPGCPTRTPKPRGSDGDDRDVFPTLRGAPAPGSQGTAHPPFQI
jgi:hypothetical protein